MISTLQRIDYYRNPSVRERIREFIGSSNGDAATCEFLTMGDENAPHLHEPFSPRALSLFFDRGFEICRSLWDRRSLIADFDVEYVNFDHAEEAFVEPERVFEIQQPVENAIKELLRSYGIPALQILSGRGHHFVWRIERDSAQCKRLSELGRGPQSLWAVESKYHAPNTKDVPLDLAHAFAGLGLVMEFLAHRVKEIATPRTRIPVELTAVEVGPSVHGREMISIDISEYGDPLCTRIIRVPFSVYLKPWQQRWAISSDVLASLPQLFVTPLQGIDWRGGVSATRDPSSMAEFGAHTSSKIPDAAAGIGKLTADYEKSDLAKFHAWFYSQEQHPPGRWPETYDRLPLEILPPCVRIILEKPNDLLLRPAHIRQLVRVLLALGWHPRHIAGLIASKYARPFGWTQFEGYDPATRADFYTRVFAGLFATGRDDLVDLNCVSAQEQKTCSFLNCGYNLLNFKDSALDRRAHDKLACRPFNRLFLSTEHY